MKKTKFKKFIKITLVLLLILVPTADSIAQWVNITSNIIENDLRLITRTPNGVLFVCTENSIYKSSDNAKTWEKVFYSRKNNFSINKIIPDASDHNTLFIATTHGVLKTIDNGKTWKSVFSKIGNKKHVYDITQDLAHPKNIYIATQDGIYSSRDKTKTWLHLKTNITTRPMFYVAVPRYTSNTIYSANKQTLIVSNDSGKTWRTIFSVSKTGKESQNTQEEMEDIAEFTQNNENISKLDSITDLKIHPTSQKKIFLATNNRIWFSDDSGTTWKHLTSQSPLDNEYIYSIAPLRKKMFAAAYNGVFVYTYKKNIWKKIDDNFAKEKINHLASFKDTLIMGVTKFSVYVLKEAPQEKQIVEIKKPQASLEQKDSSQKTLIVKIPPRPIEEIWGNEPSIQQIQNAAIKYAEVDNSKIQDFRKSAKYKAILPEISVDYDDDTNPTIDIDRGGTADPDRYIIGPSQRSRAWGVSAKWDLGELIWNADQTSIDSRSRLLVELRDDIVSEVTKLYFERKRALLVMANQDEKNSSENLEAQIHIEELTAQIDALTGGYLSEFNSKKQS